MAILLAILPLPIEPLSVLPFELPNSVSFSLKIWSDVGAYLCLFCSSHLEVAVEDAFEEFCFGEENSSSMSLAFPHLPKVDLALGRDYLKIALFDQGPEIKRVLKGPIANHKPRHFFFCFGQFELLISYDPASLTTCLKSTKSEFVGVENGASVFGETCIEL
jgi:hypothetical protein